MFQKKKKIVQQEEISESFSNRDVQFCPAFHTSLLENENIGSAH